MNMLTKMTAVEAKLFLRDPGAPATVLGIPLALILVFGLIPGMKDPSAQFGGQSPLSTLIAPMAVTIVIAMLAVTLFPAALAGYREKGVLKRLSASPVPPSRLLAAQLIVNLVAAVVVILLVVGVGRIALGMALPKNPGGFALSVALGARRCSRWACWSPRSRRPGARRTASVARVLPDAGAGRGVGAEGAAAGVPAARRRRPAARRDDQRAARHLGGGRAGTSATRRDGGVRPRLHLLAARVFRWE